jgi:cell division protein FtsL
MAVASRKKKSIPLKNKLILLFLAVFILTLFISSFNTKGGLLALYRQKLLYDQLKAEIESLKEENHRLAYEIKALREDPRYIERIAREELILAREGEIIYLLPKEGK